MKKTSRIITILMLGIMMSLTAPIATQAQCPMCKIAAESNLKNGGSAGKGLNKGILLMFAMPYVMVGAIGYIWYRNRRKEEDVDFDRF